MFLNEEFISVYDELGNLNESILFEWKALSNSNNAQSNNSSQSHASSKSSLECKCDKCGNTIYKNICFIEDENDHIYCLECHHAKPVYSDAFRRGVQGVYYTIEHRDPFRYYVGVATTKDKAIEKIKAIRSLLKNIPANMDLMDIQTGEVLFYVDNLDDAAYNDLVKVINETDLLS
jgi:hypothetical protein